MLLTQAAPAGDTFTIIDARDGGLGVERDNAVEAFYDGEAVNRLANKQIRAQTWDKKIYVTVKNQTNQAFWIDWVNYDGFQHNQPGLCDANSHWQIETFETHPFVISADQAGNQKKCVFFIKNMPRPQGCGKAICDIVLSSLNDGIQLDMNRKSVAQVA